MPPRPVLSIEQCSQLQHGLAIPTARSKGRSGWRSAALASPGSTYTIYMIYWSASVGRIGATSSVPLDLELSGKKKGCRNNNDPPQIRRALPCLVDRGLEKLYS